MVSPLLVAIPWAGSVVFTGASCFRLGYWWNATELQGRHAVGNVARQDAGVVTDEVPDDTAEGIGSSPVRSRWWSEEDDTEELPRITDYGEK